MGWSSCRWSATEEQESRTWPPAPNVKCSCWVWHFVPALPSGTWVWTMSSCHSHKWSILPPRCLLWPSPRWSWASSTTSSNTQPWCPSAWGHPSASWERSSSTRPAASLCSQQPCWGVSSLFSRVSASLVFPILLDASDSWHLFCCCYRKFLREMLENSSSHFTDIRGYSSVFPWTSQQSAVLELFSDSILSPVTHPHIKVECLTGTYFVS